MIAMVDHQFCLASVNADIFAGDEACLVGCQKQHHVGNVQGISHPACRLLDGIGAFVNGVGGVDPAGGDGVDPDAPGKAHRQGMGQGRDAALGRGVALGLGLAHPVPGGGDVDDAGPGCKIGGEELA